MEATFEFKKLINKKGFYAKVHLNLILVEKTGTQLKFDINSPWHTAVDFALRYFYEQYSKTSKGGLELTIVDLDHQIVDTTNMVVFFVVLKALYKASGIDGQIEIDDYGNFIVPK